MESLVLDMENPTGQRGAGHPAVADPALAGNVAVADFQQSLPASVLTPLKSCLRGLTARTFRNQFISSNSFDY